MCREKNKVSGRLHARVELNDFMDLRSQFGTSSWGGARYLPMAFTEHGVLMLASVLNSERAGAENP